MSYKRNSQRLSEEVGHGTYKNILDPDPSILADPLYPSDIRSDLTAYTPVFRGGQNGMFIVNDKYLNHGPDGESRNYTPNEIFPEWDQVTTMSLWIPDTYTVEQQYAHRLAVYEFLFPGDEHCIIGLEQLYNQIEPFADPTSPTISEIELWQQAVWKHFRQLVGLATIDIDPELFLKARFSEERKNTDIWDSYGGEIDSAYGPCVAVPGNIHCGETFVPDTIEEQSPYWNDYYSNYPTPTTHSLMSYNSGGATAIMPLYWGPWMMNLSRQLRNFMRGGGYKTSGHAGPFLFRPKYGIAIHSNGGGARYKFSGPLENPPAGYTF